MQFNFECLFTSNMAKTLRMQMNVDFINIINQVY